jgi:acetyl esterase
VRKVLIGLFIVVATIAAAFLLSPWPSVFVIRTIFDSGAAEASAKLEKHLPRSIQTETRQYDPADADAFMDIHRPTRVLVGTPIIVWVHGGGFVSGRRSDLTNYTKILAGQGFVVVNIDYTIAPDAKYPVPVRQVNEALGYLSRNAQAPGVNPDHIVLAGDSAGAQIAAQTAAVIASPRYAQIIGIEPSLSDRQIAGVLLFCGVYDVTRMGKGGGLIGWFMKSTTWAYSGERDWRDAKGFESMNVAPNITSNYPPAFVSAGNADPLGPQSVSFADSLEAKGVVVDRLFFPSGYEPPLGHEYQFDLDTAEGKEALTKLVTWLRTLPSQRQLASPARQ